MRNYPSRRIRRVRLASGLCIASLASCRPEPVDRWVEVYRDSVEVKRVNVGRLVRLPDSSLRVWIRSEYQKTHTGHPAGTRTATVESRVRCSVMQMRDEFTTYRDSAGAVVGRDDFRELDTASARSWQTIEPGTQGDSIARLICHG